MIDFLPMSEIVIGKKSEMKESHYLRKRTKVQKIKWGKKGRGRCSLIAELIDISHPFRIQAVIITSYIREAKKREKGTDEILSFVYPSLNFGRGNIS